MSTWITNNFDIDLWIKLAADHPFKFEQQRQQWLEQSIRDAEPHLVPRLRGIQWEIYMDLEIARNKFRTCKNVSSRLVDHLIEFKELLLGTQPIYMNPRSATVLQFVQPQD